MTVLHVEENIESLDLLFMTDRKVKWYNFEKQFFNFWLSQDIFTQEKKKYAHTKTCNTNVHNILIVYWILKLERLRDPREIKRIFCGDRSILYVVCGYVLWTYTSFKSQQIDTLSSCSFCRKVIPLSSLNSTRSGIKTSKYESLFCLFKLFASCKFFGFRIKRIIYKTLCLCEITDLDSIY